MNLAILGLDPLEFSIGSPDDACRDTLLKPHACLFAFLCDHSQGVGGGGPASVRVVKAPEFGQVLKVLGEPRLFNGSGIREVDDTGRVSVLVRVADGLVEAIGQKGRERMTTPGWVIRVGSGRGRACDPTDFVEDVTKNRVMPALYRFLRELGIDRLCVLGPYDLRTAF